LDLALQVKPKDAFALRHRGDAKRQIGEFAGAMADLDLSLEMEPKNACALRSRGQAIKDVPLLGLALEQKKWAVVGAGPVGLALAMSMAASMQEQGLDATEARIDVYESRWVEWSPADAKWCRPSVFSDFLHFFCNHQGFFR